MITRTIPTSTRFLITLHFFFFLPPRYLPKWMGGGEADCGVKVEMILMGLGFWHPKSRTCLFRANTTGPRPAPVQLTTLIFSNQRNGAKPTGERNQEKKGTRNKRKKRKRRRVSVLYYGYLYPSCDFHQPTRLSSTQPCRHIPPPSSCLSL